MKAGKRLPAASRSWAAAAAAREWAACIREHAANAASSAAWAAELEAGRAVLGDAGDGRRAAGARGLEDAAALRRAANALGSAAELFRRSSRLGGDAAAEHARGGGPRRVRTIGRGGVKSPGGAGEAKNR